MMQNALQH
uniref:Uncharacterized protein n=1 Tax=Rhizophora mucronata TaxID=61149 RepID=A0A2P2PYY8_RHIMU